MVTAVPIAYAMTRYSFAGKWWMNILLNLPLSLPPRLPVLRAADLFVAGDVSPIGQFLSGIGLYVVYTPVAIVIAQFFVNLPYMIRIARSALGMISPRYEYVARTRGCSEWGAYSQVTLPMGRSGLAAGVVITWSKAMGEFGAVLMLAGDIAMKTETLPIAFFF